MMTPEKSISTALEALRSRALGMAIPRLFKP